MAIISSIISGTGGSGGGSSAPTGPAGGDLGGVYPGPTVVSLTGTAGVVAGPSTAITIGSTTAAAGSIRLPNATTALAARNAGNTADILIARTDSSNNVFLGDQTNTAAIRLQSPSSAGFAINANAQYAILSTTNFTVRNANINILNSSDLETVKIAPSSGLGIFGGPAGTNYAAAIGPMPGFLTTNSGVWFLTSPATAPTSANVAIYGNGSQTIINVPVSGQYVGFLDAGSTYFGQWSTDSLKIMQGSLKLDSASGTFPTDGFIRTKEYIAATNFWRGVNSGGEANIVRQQSAGLTFGDDNNVSGWNTNLNGYNLTVNARTGTSWFSPSIFLGDYATATTRITLVPDVAALITFAASNTSNTIKQADLTTNSGTGATLTIQSQNETGTTSTGGNLVLQAGTGTSTNGTVVIKSGTTQVASLMDSAYSFTSTGSGIFTASSYNMFNGGVTHFASGLTSRIQVTADSATNTILSAASNTEFQIGYFDLTTNSATGGTLRVRSQNATGTSATGGPLILRGGTGTLAYGSVHLHSAIAPQYLAYTFTSDADQTLTAAQSALMNLVINAGVISTTRTLTVSITAADSPMILVKNNNANTVNIQFLTGTAVAVATNTSAWITTDGTNAVKMMAGT